MSKLARKLVQRKVGSDAGNNSLKIMVGEEAFFVYDNIIASRGKVNYDMDNISSKNLDDMLDVSVTLNVGHKDETLIRTKDFLLGNMAKRYPSLCVERVKNEKSQDYQLIMSSLVAIANSIIVDTDKSELTEILDIEIDLCTGLPFSEWAVKAKREKYKNMYLGNHQIVFNNEDYPVKIVNINVVDVRISIEGMPALTTTLLFEGYEEKFSPKELAEKTIAMVDIGSYTCDFAGGIYKSSRVNNELQVTLEPAFQLSTGLMEGVGSAMDNTNADLRRVYEEKFGVNEKITKKDMLDAYLYGDMVVSGKDIKISPYFEKHCVNLGAEIALTLTNLYDTNGYKSNLKTIFLSGGGSLIPYIVDSFKRTLEDQGYDPSIVVISENIDPVYVNAIGYYVNAIK